jgi:hypothetical protein
MLQCCQGDNQITGETMKTRAAIACFYLCLVTANAACFWWVHQMDAATFYIICSTLIGFFWGVADHKTAQRQRELDEIELMLDRSYAQERFRATGGGYAGYRQYS